MKAKFMKMSEWFEYTNPNYLFLRLTPSYSIRNYNSGNFISLIARLYVSMNDRISSINKKLIIEGNAKLGYYIYMEKERVEFYFIVPEKHFNLFKDKIIDTWSNKITITKVEDIPQFSQECTAYYMVYKKNDALSLTCDSRNNTLICGQLSTLHVMEQGDKVGVFYNFIPMQQKTWKATWDNAVKDMQESISAAKCKSIFSAAVIRALNFSLKIVDVALDAITFNNNAEKKKPLKDLELGPASKKKRGEYIAKCQILCFSESTDRRKEKELAVSMCSKFECLNENNVLVSHKINPANVKKINLLDTQIKGIPTNKIQPGEGQNFISLPGREPLEEFKIIQRTEVLECDTPAVLRKGVMCIGYNQFKDELIKTYLPMDPRLRNLALVIIGPTRAGKTTLISNITKDATDGMECTILFDFCGHCELSDTVNSVIIKDKILNIDCSDLNNLEGMGYNEVGIINGSVLEQYEVAKIKTSQLKTLIDACNDDDRELKAKMDKYLKAASLVVFINNGSINDVFEVLLNHKPREKYIKLIPADLLPYLDDKIQVLNELDEKNNKGFVTGSKMTPAINGIMDRLENLKTNTYMELMLKKDCSNNINLLEEIQKNQVICLRMPERMFSTEAEKDAYCTYWMSKIWLAVKFRDDYMPREKQVKVNLIIDELSQVEYCENFVRSKLSQMAKFNCKTILSCHYLNQIKIIRSELRSASASYMLIAGCDKENYDELKHELEPYTVEDLLRLKEFNSLNLIKLGDGYAKFVTHLPDKLSK